MKPKIHHPGTLFAFSLRTHRHGTAPLYIQSRGLHAGRPLRQPIPNSVQVHTTYSLAFEAATAAYLSGAYRNAIRGSVIPFITLADMGQVLAEYFQRAAVADPQRLAILANTTSLITNAEARLAQLHSLRTLIARSV